MESVSISGRRVAILADGHLDFHFGKTAIGIIRYRPNNVVAVIDRGMAGSTTAETIGVGGNIPIVATLDEALEYRPEVLVLGVATRGGAIPDEWRPVLRQAITGGLDVIGGLHQFLSEDAELSGLAARHGVTLVDVRKPPATLQVATARRHRPECTVVTFVGSDCAVGKMSVALDVEADAKRRGVDAHFVATGQTGMMIAGNGVPLDGIIGDFMAGAIEGVVLEAAAVHEVVLVEGQGSLLHPGYSGVTLALIHGSQPDAMILTVMLGRSTIDEYEIPIPPALEMIEMHEAAAGWIKPSPVIALAVNSLGISDGEAQHAIEHITTETGLPATDTFRFGASVLVDAIQEFRLARAGNRAATGAAE